MQTYVDQEMVKSHQRIDEVEGLIEANQTQLEAQEGEIAKVSEATIEASGTAKDALERAIAAGKLAEGRFLYETVLTDNQLRFASDAAELGEVAMEALDTFATGLKQADENVFIEIQGHTDATGPAEHNLELGEERAEAVRRYLNREQGLALHRMSVISYGEGAPIADNSERAGREQNRRVALVVLK
jgi:outer membrane protein OmpA-like peptidoglycan-associated protein